MRSPLTFTMHSSRKQRQLNAAALALVLCLWLVAFASHVHARDDASAAGEASTACSFCLSFPSGAAAPALPALASPQLIVAGVVVPAVDVVDVQDVPSFYSSRAPPSR